MEEQQKKLENITNISDLISLKARLYLKQKQDKIQLLALLAKKAERRKKTK
jgi:hypothetical protein